MFIELHILQSFAPSNLNRDDTGNPKDTEFGGVRRARISSQCIKRSIRQHPVFAETTRVDLAVRTRWITRLLTKPLKDAGKSEEQALAVAEAFATQYSKLDKKGNTVVLLYLSDAEIKSAVQYILETWDQIIPVLGNSKNPTIEELAKRVFKDLKNRTSAPDIAMFGRMLAEKPELNIDAACQVAHAISTHRVNMEMDFYTAVDDLTKDDETGAGMMGVIPFNSACFYRYARVDWEQLVKNLGGDATLARRTVEGFLRASVLAVPTGKQTGFAANNPPDFLLGLVRRDGQSWSLANAFEKPVRSARDGGYVSTSASALEAYWDRLQTVYGQEDIAPVVLAANPEITLNQLKAAAASNLDGWINALLTNLPEG
jgi:CRISPR system Cascade subunit CasC